MGLQIAMLTLADLDPQLALAGDLPVTLGDLSPSAMDEAEYILGFVYLEHVLSTCFEKDTYPSSSHIRSRSTFTEKVEPEPLMDSVDLEQDLTTSSDKEAPPALSVASLPATLEAVLPPSARAELDSIPHLMVIRITF
jgi:hypothetical protein